MHNFLIPTTNKKTAGVLDMPGIVTVRNRSQVGLKGVHTLSTCDMTSPEAQFLERKLEALRLEREKMILSGRGTEDALRAHWRAYKHYLALLNDNFLVRQVTVRNITTTVGRAVFAARFSGTTTYTGIANYGSLGTSATAATVGDTQLGAEVYRKALSSGTFASNIAYLENFYTAAETSGTYNEYAFWIDATGTANSGQMANRFISNITKSVTESLNVQSIFTFSDI